MILIETTLLFPPPSPPLFLSPPPRGRCKLPDVPLTKVVEPVRYWVKSLPQARISAPPGGKVEKKVHDYFSDEEQEFDEILGAK